MPTEESRNAAARAEGRPFESITKRDGRIVAFDPNRISAAIAKAGAATRDFGADEARRLAVRVLAIAGATVDGAPTVERIQDIVEEVLLASPHRRAARAYIVYREQHRALRAVSDAASVALVDRYLDRSDWQVAENANMAFSLQGLNNHLASHLSSTYWLERLYPPEVREAHRSGDLHLHDLNLLAVYCVGWDLADLLAQGFRGASGKAESGPARHFRTALGQIANFFYTLQGEAAGAQAFSSLDTYLAPFIRRDGLGYDEVKQALQEFVFNLNVPTRVGFQTPFTNVTLDLDVPKLMRDEPGSIGVVTLNLPRLGHLARDEADFLARLDRLMDVAKESLVIKRKVLERYTEDGLYPYVRHYLRDIRARHGQYWHNHFNTIGLVGLAEAAENLLGQPFAGERGRAFGLRVLDHMRARLVAYQAETGTFFNLEATPAEGTSYRLARLDKARFPALRCANEDAWKRGGQPYYTNSSQLPVDATDDVFAVLDHQDELQARYTGGTVQHVFVGEAIDDPAAVKRFVRTVCERYRLPYFTVTPTFSVCPEHGYAAGEHPRCPRCGAPAEVYSRVVGYLRPVQQWNPGKQAEFEGRRS